MAEQEIDNLVVRLTGDGSSYKQMMQTAQTETKKSGEQVEQAGFKFHLAGRSITGVGGAIKSTIHGAGGLEQLAASADHVALGLGRSFGLMGVAVGVGLGIAISAVTKQLNEMMSKAKESAGKAFAEYASGAKTMEEAFASVNLDNFKKRIFDAAEKSTSVWARIWAGGVDQQEYFNSRVLRATKEQEDAAKGLQGIMNSSTGAIGKHTNIVITLSDAFVKATSSAEELRKEMLAAGYFSMQKEIGGAINTLNKLKDAQADLAKWRQWDKEMQDFAEAFGGVSQQSQETKNALEEVEKAAQSLDAQMKLLGNTWTSAVGKQMRDLGIKDQLRGADSSIIAIRKQLADLEQAEKEFGKQPWMDKLREGYKQLEKMTKNDSINEFFHKLNMDVRTSGLEGYRKEVEQLIAKMGITDELMIQAMKDEADWANAVTKGKEQIRSLAEAHEKYGVTEAEFIARRMERVGNFAEAAKVRAAEAQNLLDQVGKEVEVYTLTMQRATKAEIAAAQANNPYEAHLARVKTLFSEATRITEAAKTPLQHYADTQRGLDEVMGAGLITQETYNRSLIKARKELDGVREAVQGVTTISADAMSHLLEYRDNLNLMKKPPPASPASLRGSAEGLEKVERERQVKALEKILEEIKRGNDKPKANILPAGLGN